MKRVIVQILPADNPSSEHFADEILDRSDLNPINGRTLGPVAVSRETDPEIRVEAVISSERARVVVDYVLNVNESVSTDSFDQLVDLLIRRELAHDDSGQLFHRVMSSVEKALVELAFAECGHIQTRTAERLGVNRNTIHKKLLKHALLRAEDVPIVEPKDEVA